MPPMSEWESIIYKCSPAYTIAYQEGYEQAMKEMQEMLNQMQALYGQSSTVGGVS